MESLGLVTATSDPRKSLAKVLTTYSPSTTAKKKAPTTGGLSSSPQMRLTPLVFMFLVHHAPPYLYTFGPLSSCFSPYLTLTSKRDLEESGEEDLAILDPSLCDEHLSRARPILLGTLDDLETRRLDGKLSNRDFILLAQSTFTTIARLTPPDEKGEPEGEGTTFVFQTPQQIELEVQKRLRELQEAEGIIEGEVIERTLEN